MNMEYIRKFYAVPAKLGGRVEIADGLAGNRPQGVIVGSRGGYLRVRIRNEPHIKSYHP